MNLKKLFESEKLIFQFWILKILIKKNLWTENLCFNSETHSFNSFKKHIWTWNLIFEYENCSFNSLKTLFEFENSYLTSKNLFDLKIDIQNWYYYI